jgi:hypothetical protein
MWRENFWEEVQANGLLETHRITLAHYKISDQLIRTVEIHSINDAQAREFVEANGKYPDEDLSGFLIPYLDPFTRDFLGGRVRRDRGEPKYLTNKGNKHLYIPPCFRNIKEVFEDVSTPAVIVEADKSALAIVDLCFKTARRFLPIAIGGAWAFLRNAGKRPKKNSFGAAASKSDCSRRWAC